MNIQKYGQGNCGLLQEADRSMYEEVDTASHSLIDKSKTELNYNLCPHQPYTRKEIAEINKRIRDVKTLRKDANTWFGCVITIPKDYEGSYEDFFQAAYICLKKEFGLTDDDVISSYVHLDETTPHMHFYAIPHVYPNEKLAQKIYGKMQNETDAKKILKYEKEGLLAMKESVSWERFMPFAKYKTFHQDMEKLMADELGKEVHLLNGKTLGIDLQKLPNNIKKQVMELFREKEKLSEELANTKQDLVSARDELAMFIDKGKQQIDALNRQIEVLKKGRDRFSDELDSLLQTMEYEPSQIPNIMDRAKTLQQTLKYQGKQYTNLQERIQEKQEDISALQKQIVDLEAKETITDKRIRQKQDDFLKGSYIAKSTLIDLLNEANPQLAKIVKEVLDEYELEMER